MAINLGNIVQLNSQFLFQIHHRIKVRQRLAAYL